LHINHEEILWSDKLKSLGVLFISGKHLTVDIVAVLCKFYASVNAVLHGAKYASELTKLSLLGSCALLGLT